MLCSQRFHIALHPARMSSVAQLTTVVQTVAILHNMVTVERREGFVSRRRSGYGMSAPGSGVDDSEGAGAEGTGGGVSAAAAGAGCPGGGGVSAAAAGVGCPGGCGVAGLGPAAGLHGGGKLPGLPGLAPVVVPLAQSPAVRAMLAWREVRSAQEHVALQDDLAEHVWEHRGELLTPYVTSYNKGLFCHPAG